MATAAAGHITMATSGNISQQLATHAGHIPGEQSVFVRHGERLLVLAAVPPHVLLGRHPPQQLLPPVGEVTQLVVLPPVAVLQRHG